MRMLIAALSFLFMSLNVSAGEGGVQVALSAKEKGDYKTAISIFETLAEKGDSKAMAEIGLMYFDESKETHNYDLAYDWFLKAANAGDWDSVNNIGVMFRDGLGVDKNKYVAYDIFMLIHLVGSGQNTISRANNNLVKLQAELSESEITEALELPVRYVMEYMRLKSNVSEEIRKLKDRKSERSFVDLYKKVYG